MKTKSDIIKQVAADLGLKCVDIPLSVEGTDMTKPMPLSTPQGKENKMKNTIICDLDGTLANCEHRVHHVQRVDGNGLKKKPDWDSFYAGVKDDDPNHPVYTVIYNHLDCSGLHKVIFCTGRPERCRADTVEWLNDKAYLYPRHYTLLMRKDGDFRADYIVKQEILDTQIDKDSVLFVLDDRQQVVDMWRRNGLICFQVAPGDF